MNTRLLRRIQKHILDEPKSLDMSDFAYYRYVGGPKCGTVACIAGWAHLLTHPDLIGHDTRHLYSISPNDGKVALGLSDKEVEILFYVENWPQKFWHQYGLSKSDYGRARATVRRIDHFIKTEGRE